MQFSILGPLTVSVDGRQISLGPLKQQLVLALLLCRANTVTSVDLLTETLWADEPPRTARKNLQVYIGCLRKLLAGDSAGNRVGESAERLVHRNGGYLLRVHPAELDRLRFEELVTAARQPEVGSTAALLGQALSLTRGGMLDGLADHPVLRGEADRFARKWLAVFEDWAEAELALGNAVVIVERICELASEHPFRERLRQIQMTALHLSGRQSEALGVFEELRLSLARELGLRPSPSLERLYRAVLSGEPVLKVGRLQQPTATGPVRQGSLVVLPPNLSDFTGRDEPLADALTLLSDDRTRLIVLSGPVGAGKTSLSVQLAHQLAKSFPDGRVFLRLRNDQGEARSCLSLLRELGRLTGVSSQSSDIDELAAGWQGWLLERRVLLLLDSAVDAATVRDLLPSAGASKVLVTSRSRLTELDFADRLELAPMQPDEAVALLGRIAGTGRVVADPASAAAIVQAVGLMPLAVRTAGNKLSRLRHLPLAEFAARLADPDGMLDELSTGDDVLRGRLAASIADLSGPEREALRRLGALANPWFTLDEAAAVLDEGTGGVGRVRRLLESLIEANAVTAPNAEVMAHAVVYELPPLLRCFTRELG